MKESAASKAVVVLPLFFLRGSSATRQRASRGRGSAEAHGTADSEQRVTAPALGLLQNGTSMDLGGMAGMVQSVGRWPRGQLSLHLAPEQRLGWVCRCSKEILSFICFC